MIALQPLEKPFEKHIMLPGCIGYTIRALNIAAMTKGSVRIVNPLKSDDTYAMVRALQTLGIAIEETQNAFVVHGDIADVVEKDYTIDIGLSGRTARSILGLLAIVPGNKLVTCKESFKNRPIGDLVDGLRQLGANIAYLENEGHLPIKITSSKLKPGTAKMKGEISSQYFSSLMMIAPIVGDMTISVIGKQSSKPFIDMTTSIMKEFGISVVNQNYQTYTIKKQTYINPEIYQVEPEATSASYFFGIAALTKSTIRILNINPHSSQGDIRFVDMLEQMGCLVKKNSEQQWIEVTGTEKLKGITVDMNATPDLVPTLAVVAAFAIGTTTMTDIAHVRVKETDRIASPQTELAKMRIETEATEDTFSIIGGNPKAAQIDTYHDHRIAMAFAIAGSKIPGMMINDADVVSKSFPNYWEKLEELGIKTKGVS
ncbi:MAG: 3-phosphoshikimate 1-carboxyvinyltransferase [Candidatus Levyibacteriota bacterium]